MVEERIGASIIYRTLGAGPQRLVIADNRSFERVGSCFMSADSALVARIRESIAERIPQTQILDDCPRCGLGRFLVAVGKKSPGSDDFTILSKLRN